MDGLLVVDKPAGPTSHDVVARVRRVLRERRVGHTGTLDPIATGVLPLVVGRATRLARFLSASDKSYEAVIAFGCATDTGDATGHPIETRDRPPHTRGAIAAPSREEIERALNGFRGTYLQQPPAYSAKKIGGKRSYELARRALRQAQGERDSKPLMVSLSSFDGAQDDPERAEGSNHERPERPEPTTVTVHRLELLGVAGDAVTLGLDCSAGFYVRSLAHELGEQLGVGAHLVALRRTRSGDYSARDAVTLDEAERDAASAAGRLIPLSRMLPTLPAIDLTPGGVRRARHGQNLGPGDANRGWLEPLIPAPAHRPYVRLRDPAGDLIGIARPAGAPGLLHPFVILG